MAAKEADGPDHRRPALGWEALLVLLGMMYGGDISRSTPSKMSFGGIGRWMFKKMMKAKRVPSLPKLRQMAIDLGVKLYGCQMSMDVEAKNLFILRSEFQSPCQYPRHRE